MIRKVHHPDGNVYRTRPLKRNSATSPCSPRLRVVGQRVDSVRQRPGRQVGERDVLDHLAQVLAQRDPHALQRLGRARRRSRSPGRSPRTAASGPSTARITSATLISAAGRFSRCPPSAPRTLCTSPAWRRSERMFSEEALRDALGGGDRLGAHGRAGVLGGGELGGGAHRVVGLGGDLHRATAVGRASSRARTGTALGAGSASADRVPAGRAAEAVARAASARRGSCGCRRTSARRRARPCRTTTSPRGGSGWPARRTVPENASRACRRPRRAARRGSSRRPGRARPRRGSARSSSPPPGRSAATVRLGPGRQPQREAPARVGASARRRARRSRRGGGSWPSPPRDAGERRRAAWSGARAASTARPLRARRRARRCRSAAARPWRVLPALSVTVTRTSARWRVPARHAARSAGRRPWSSASGRRPTEICPPVTPEARRRP